MTAWILTFFALAITDICWAVYVSSVKDDAPTKAALWSIFLFLTGAFAVIGYTKDSWLLIPACAGAGVGTYIGVLINRRKTASTTA